MAAPPSLACNLMPMRFGGCLPALPTVPPVLSSLQTSTQRAALCSAPWLKAFLEALMARSAFGAQPTALLVGGAPHAWAGVAGIPAQSFDPSIGIPVRPTACRLKRLTW